MKEYSDVSNTHIPIDKTDCYMGGARSFLLYVMSQYAVVTIAPLHRTSKCPAYGLLVLWQLHMLRWTSKMKDRVDSTMGPDGENKKFRQNCW
jgi:hypothetical protein